MLQHLVHFFLISCICCTWGLPLLLLTGVAKTQHPWYRSIPAFMAFLFILGCLTLCFIGSWLYLFLPLKFTTLAGLTLVLLLVLYFWGRPGLALLLQQVKNTSFSFSWPASAFLLTSLLVFLGLSCLRSDNGDTHIYHLQIIEWEAQYRVVPGIANLFPRIGLGSGWFGLISFFYLPFFSQENYFYLNFSLVSWGLIWLLSSWSYHFTRLSGTTGSRVLCLYYFLILVYAFYDWQLFRDAANSTNYDFIVTIATLLPISFLLEGIWTPDYDKSFSAVFIFLALSAAGLKFSGIFLLLPLGYYLLKYFSPARLLGFLLFGFLVLAPTLIRNFIVSGYPLYPLSITAGSPDWQVPKGLVDLLHNYITLSNRFINQDFVNSYSFKEQHSFWFPIWLGGLGWMHRALLLLVLSSTLLLFINPGSSPDRRRLRHYILLLLLMIAGWFFTAPNPRFAYGVLMAAAFLPVSIWLGPKIRPRWYTIALWGATLSLFIYLPAKFAVMLQQPSLFLRPRSVDIPPYKTIRSGTASFHLPDRIYNNYDRRCYNTPIPCICEENPWLRPRGPSPGDGFRMTAPDSAFIQNYNY
jgi:hypothetical protein